MAVKGYSSILLINVYSSYIEAGSASLRKKKTTTSWVTSARDDHHDFLSGLKPVDDEPCERETNNVAKVSDGR